MTDTAQPIWIDPTDCHYPEHPAREAPTNRHLPHQVTWDETRQFRPRMHPVGRLRYYHKWPGHGARLWSRVRYWPTRRRVLNVRGEYNPKTMRREKTIVDKRPIWWALAFVALLLAPLFAPAGAWNTVMSAAAVFAIYSAVNLCWMLIIGTAGIFSLATYAVVGAAAYGTTYLAIRLGLPWWMLPLLGSLIGLAFGMVIALPAMRLDGFYYALLTLGVVELCRVYVVQSREFGSATGGLYGAPSYLPAGLAQSHRLLLGYYAALALMVLALVIYRFIDGKRLGRVLRMAPEKREAFAQACGVDYIRARIQVFLISSTALGFIGGFYATHFGGASPNLFSFDTLLLSLAMLVIGGIGRAEGAVAGTAIVVFIDRILIDLGPLRFILIGAIMLAVVLFLRDGLFGIKQQFRTWRDKKKSERRATRSEKGGEMLPEEATETEDKDQIFFRRFDKMQRDFLKRLVSDAVIEEHRMRPLGQHSEPLERLLIYFRRQGQVDKYAIMVIEEFKAYRIVALSGHRGTAPRVVEDRLYGTPDEAYHALFLRRVQDLLES
ncbi:branched-chain amino acid ABC transporter permease [Bradyrhizobium sp. WD16]|uniref:branched-chain amino acid ABC transporter permease n=1 Tax=Bradyrhizobium sp. WD16 TaxID=1521768 RepID=UPI0020A5C8D1|nr:branched-chain amino acid ABC transporter permease [Bradyrhizobium sp. WD16]UTD26271.1 branched-chain amino acid ABC transporter permease [Bradyrhizobium sp. WD16]